MTMKLADHIFAGKGATAYEFQVGPFWFMACHLTGKYWRWKPWRRVSFGWDKDYWSDQDVD